MDKIIFQILGDSVKNSLSCSAASTISSNKFKGALFLLTAVRADVTPRKADEGPSIKSVIFPNSKAPFFNASSSVVKLSTACLTCFATGDIPHVAGIINLLPVLCRHLAQWCLRKSRRHPYYKLPHRQ